LAEPAAFTIQEHVASDGYRWRYRRYVPVGPARAEVVCLHGIQSHAGWYEYSCRRLQQAGFAVSFLDRRGSGLNQQDRGDAVGGFRRLLDDIGEYLSALRQTGVGGQGITDSSPPGVDARKKPIFLVAISWGGRLGAALQWRHPGLVDGLALLCPGIFPQVGSGLAMLFKVLWSRLFAPRRLFPIPLNDPTLFTANERWQQFIRDDPLALHQASGRFLFTNNRLSRYLWMVPKRVRIPVLLLLAGNDRIIKNERTRRYVGRFASSDKQVIEYPGAHHTLEFERDPDRFIADMLAWLERICGS
jgi:alpha-beta hydrolase superfamily lysophospholipase